MPAGLLLGFVIGYFILLLIVAWYTSRNANNDSFFIGNRNSNWMLVAFGMIGTSLSGVTFVSVPGGVGASSFAYFQIMIGYLIGYLVIAYVLLPLYYRLNLTSIYNYLSTRLGVYSYKTGASFFYPFAYIGCNGPPLPGGKDSAGYDFFQFQLCDSLLGHHANHPDHDPDLYL